MNRYFLARRNWSEYNHGIYIGWPIQEFAGSTPEDGDVGFEMNHEVEDFPNDCAQGVVKVSKSRRMSTRTDEIRPIFEALYQKSTLSLSDRRIPSGMNSSAGSIKRRSTGRCIRWRVGRGGRYGRIGLRMGAVSEDG